MLHISKITTSPVWIMLTSQRTWLHIGILHQAMERKKQDTTFLAKGRFITSLNHMGDNGISIMKTNQRFSRYLEVTLIGYTWYPARRLLFSLVLILWLFLETLSFSLHSQITVGEHDAKACVFKGEGAWSVIQDTDRNIAFLIKVSLSSLHSVFG